MTTFVYVLQPVPGSTDRSADDQETAVRAYLKVNNLPTTGIKVLRDQAIAPDASNALQLTAYPGYVDLLKKINEGVVDLLVVDEFFRFPLFFQAEAVMKQVTHRGGRFIAMAERIDAPPDAPADHGVLPDHKRGRPSLALQGMPERANVEALARHYVMTQRRLWPRLPQGVLPGDDTLSIRQMADQFMGPRREFYADLIHWARRARVTSLGAAYSRYSCDNSNPRSLDDQLTNQLTRAAQDGVLIPWCLVFADAAITGTRSERQGYQAVMDFFNSAPTLVTTLYVDDLSRASRSLRDSIELANTLEHLQRRLVGVSDGIDSQQPNSRLMLSVMSLVNEDFIGQLRTKVRRGMRGAASRGTSLGRPATGYKLVPMVDPQGLPVLAGDNQPLNTYAIDEDARWVVERAFEAYAVDLLSYRTIAKEFNSERAGGDTAWTAKRVKMMLERRLYMGVLTHSTARQKRDPRSDRLTVVDLPPDQWVVTPMPHLQIISPDLWKKARLRALATRGTAPSPRQQTVRRNSVYPSTLFSGTLFCGYCGSELRLMSSGNHRSLGCLNGKGNRHGCQLTTSKAVKIIERELLETLRHELLRPEHLQELVEQANAHLQVLAQREQVDVDALERQLRAIRASQQSLVRAIETSGEHPEAITRRLTELEQQADDLDHQIAKASRDAQPVPPPLMLETMTPLLADIAALLEHETGPAALAIRKLTGPITITQLPSYRRRGADWQASFKGNLVPLLSFAARRRRQSAPSGSHIPDWDTLEYLRTQNWNLEKPIVCTIRSTPLRERLAPTIASMAQSGLTCPQIASQLGHSESLVVSALRHQAALAGQPIPGMPVPWRSLEARAEDLVEQVGHLRHVEGLDWPKIIKRLGSTRAVVEKAHAMFHQRHGDDHPGVCGRMKKAVCPELPEILRLRDLGWSTNKIAKHLGISHTWVATLIRRSNAAARSRARIRTREA